MNAQLKIVKMSENAILPSRGSAQAAGLDLYSAYNYTINPMDKALIKTDLQMGIPEGCYGRVAPRSGLALKHFIHVGGGVIDRDYTGNVGVILYNFGKDEFNVTKGDRIAQFILEKIYIPTIVEVDFLQMTERGVSGFGSTGQK